MRTRIISGVIMAAGGVAALLIGGAFAGLIVMLIALGAYYELCKACGVLDKEKTPVNLATVMGYAVIILFYLNMIFGKAETGDVVNIIVLIALVLWQLAVYVFTYPRFKSGQIMAGVFNVLYAPFMLSFLYPMMVGFEHGKYIVFLVFVASSISDACAYFVGVSIGKHKLAPVVSPKKSIEGSVGGIVGAALIGMIYGIILTKAGIFPQSKVIWEFALIGGLGSIVSQIGDLAASAIKRDFGIKDYSKLIPGHGGIMDRMDSICVTTPIIYYLAYYLLK